MFKIIADKYNSYREQRFLKKHGCATWEQYDKKYDFDINKKADTIKDFYIGYPYVYIFKDTSKEVFTKHYDWIDGYKELEDWCQNNCVAKFRSDIHTVHVQTNLDFDGNIEVEYFFNGLGHDYLFFAFKNDTDYIWFITRWA